MPAASIVIPVFNGADYIGEALQSALGQGDADFEVVVCDNASSDGTRAIAETFADDSRLRYVRFDDHLSMPASFNRGLAQADGKYVRFLCHDDLLRPDCLNRSVALLDTHAEAVMLTSYEKTFGVKSIDRGQSSLGPSGLRPSSEVRRRIVRRGNWIGGPTAVTLRVSAISGPLFREDLTCSFDVEGWLRLLLKGDLYVHPEVLFGSRIHPDQATSECAQGGFRRDWFEILRILGKSEDAADSPTAVELRMSWIKNFIGRY